MSWRDAYEACRSLDGGNLISILNQEEQIFFHYQVEPNLSVPTTAVVAEQQPRPVLLDKYWIGLNSGSGIPGPVNYFWAGENNRLIDKNFIPYKNFGEGQPEKIKAGQNGDCMFINGGDNNPYLSSSRDRHYRI